MDKEKNRHIILFVDDEEAILKSLARLFRRHGYTILTASGGEEALTLIGEQEKKISVIISDQKMPKMNGAAFLEKAKQICPDAIRFLLTGYSEMGAIVDAVNRGEIHRYLTKPWNDDELIMQVKTALDHYDLIEENKKLMLLTRKQNKQLFEFGRTMEKKIEERSLEIVEQNKKLEFLNKELELGLLNTIRAFGALTEMVNPYMKGHGKRVSSLAVELARKYGLPEEEVTQIEIAAILHDIGTIGFANELIEKYNDNRCSKEEMDLYRSHPVEGQSILSFINRLDEVGLLIRHHHEQYDGKGYPDGLIETEIPLGARFIAISDVYDRIIKGSNKKKTSYLEKYLSGRNISREHFSEDELLQQAALFHFKQNSFTKYDPDIVKLFMDVLKDRGVNFAQEKQVAFEVLEPGMVITRAIYTPKGRFILPQNTELTEDLLKKLNIILENNEIPDAFFIIAK
ncbi:MAG: response regulator [Proteobacteria bacterium]|nr:response regulator [Pseudomonadota bacterium]